MHVTLPPIEFFGRQAFLLVFDILTFYFPSCLINLQGILHLLKSKGKHTIPFFILHPIALKFVPQTLRKSYFLKICYNKPFESFLKLL